MRQPPPDRLYAMHPLDAWACETAQQIEVMRQIDPSAANLMDECAASYVKGFRAKAALDLIQEPTL